MKIFTDAAKKCAEQNLKSAYDYLVNNLGGSSLSLRFETVKLINLLFTKAADKAEKEKFLAALENIGLYDALRLLTQDAIA